MDHLIEIRSYKLKPCSSDKFHRFVSEKSTPLHAAWGIDIVALGKSLHDPDAYYLIRAYNDFAHLESCQAEFYGSDDWRHGPREAIVSLILSDSNAVFWLDPSGVGHLRNSRGAV